MNTIYIITGVSKGLGNALAENILTNSDSNTFVIGLSRSICNLSERFPQTFEWVHSDLSDPHSLIPSLSRAISKYNFSKVCFISNAGDISPICLIGGHDYTTLQHSLSVNIYAPVLVINYLISQYKGIKKLLFVNISSGAANKVIKGWSLYSASKAYVKMYFDVLKEEHADENVSMNILQIDPGAMDTEMQKRIRKSDVISDQAEKLKDLFENGSLRKPLDVAQDIMQKITAVI